MRFEVCGVDGFVCQFPGNSSISTEKNTLMQHWNRCETQLWTRVLNCLRSKCSMCTCYMDSRVYSSKKVQFVFAFLYFFSLSFRRGLVRFGYFLCRRKRNIWNSMELTSTMSNLWEPCSKFSPTSLSLSTNS